MTNCQETILLLFAAVAVAHPLAMRLFAERISENRTRMFASAKVLLTSPHLSRKQKCMLRSMLRDSVSWTSLPQIAMTFPLFFISQSIRHQGRDLMSVADPETALQAEQFCDDFVKSIVAANPFFVPILAIELGLAAIVLLSKGMFRRLSEAVRAAPITAELYFDHQ